MSGSTQVNVPLSERYALVLALLRARDDRSTTELLRPVIESFLDAELEEDLDLGQALKALTRSIKARSAEAGLPGLTPEP